MVSFTIFFKNNFIFFQKLHGYLNIFNTIIEILFYKMCPGAPIFVIATLPAVNYMQYTKVY